MLNPSLIAGVHASAYRAELAELAARERERVWSETDSDESDELAGTATSNTAQNMDKTIVESNKTDAANAAFSSLSLRSSPSRPPLAASAGQNNPPVAHSYIRSHVAATKSSHEHSALFQTHRRTLSDAASPSLHYANLSHPNHVQLNLHLQPPSELSDTQWPDPHSLYAFPTLAPSAKPHVKRTGSMLDFRRVVSQQQYLPYATADSSWQQQHFNHPQNAQPQMYGQLSKMLTSPSDIGPDDVGTLFNFDEDNDLGLKYLGPEAPESGNKRTPSFDGGSSSSSSEANTWIGSYSDQGTAYGNPSNINRTHTSKSSFEDKWKSPTFSSGSEQAQNVAAVNGNQQQRQLVSPALVGIPPSAGNAPHRRGVNASPMFSGHSRASFELRFGTIGQHGGMNSGRSEGGRALSVAATQNDSSASGFKLPPTFSMDTATSQRESNYEHSPLGTMSPRPFVADSSPLLLPNSEAKNIWGAPDVNIGVSVFRNNVGSDQRVAKQELTVAGDAGRLVPSELLRRNLSFDHGASKEFSESNSRSFSTVPLSSNGNSSKKLNPLVSPFESQQQNYPFVTGQGWQYSTTHFNSYNAGNQQPTYSPSLSFNPPEQFRTENYGALTNSPNFSVSSSSRRVSSTPQYSNGTNGAESKSPEACADLRIVKEIQTSKLRVDESKLTSNYFDQLTHESIELCIHICPTMDERMRQEVAFRAVLDVARRAFPDANLHHFGSTALGFSLANADMDLSISLNDNYAKFTTAQLVEKLGVVMKNAGMRDVKMLTRARVPIVKIRDPITGIRCDIGFQSSLVMYNTRLLKAYSQIDPRFRELVFIVKYWSKQRNINEPYFGTLSSYCFVLMVIHFLQIRGVLPCLQKFAPDGTLESVTQAIPEVKVDDFNVYFYEDVARLVGEGHWTCTNTESVGELLVAFFKYYSAEFPYVHGVASVRTGSVLSKEDKGWTKDRQQEINRSGAVKDRYWLCVEDPFETTNNIGRPVDKETLFEVRGEFIRASKILCAGMSADENTLAKVCEKAPVIISKKGTGSGGGIGTNGMFMGGRKWM